MEKKKTQRQCFILTSDMACEPGPVIDSPLDHIYRKVIANIDQNLWDNILNRLEQLGYHFSNDEQKKQFVRERLVIARYDDNPHWRELFLDYGTPQQILVATWWDTIDYKTTYDDARGKWSATFIARNPPKY